MKISSATFFDDGLPEAGAPQIAKNTEGALVVSFMTDEDTSLHEWLVLFP